ncbi:peptide chain release factor N(5)-glutamine methyltransferase [Gemmatimonas sp.]|uniref:peptide chain release factor N(5)-glutamine methyltransferase n=1 Tax=Gemmatimonas sp. TaxID=1962908 RepID=UPI0039834B9B
MGDTGRLLRDVLDDAARLLSVSSALVEEAGANGAPIDVVREARWLLSAVMDVAPGELGRLLLVNQPVSDQHAVKIERAARRRATGEPMAYCVGTAPFRDLVLQVDRRVLIPRPETEIVVGEALRSTAGSPGGVAVDIGTGSGAIALSLATEGRFERVIATDLSDDALTVATTNAAQIALAQPTAAPVEFRQGADLAPLRGVLARVIVSNPPYIAYSEAAALPRSVRDWEPTVALFAADHGMARYEAILAGAHELLEPFGWVVFEVDARRAQQIATLATTRGYQQVQVVRDLTGRERVLLAQHVPA